VVGKECLRRRLTGVVFVIAIDVILVGIAIAVMLVVIVFVVVAGTPAGSRRCWLWL
jgi:ABC-type Na+ efflux pump permease subunit